MEATPRVTVSANVSAADRRQPSHPGITADSTAGSVTAAQTRSGGACSTEVPEIFIRSFLPCHGGRSARPTAVASTDPASKPGAGRTAGSGSAAWRRSGSPWRPRPRRRSPPPPE